jgi:hypothetical protein
MAALDQLPEKQDKKNARIANNAGEKTDRI